MVHPVTEKIRKKASDARRQMILRCTDPTNKRFADYGGRGITVCDRWLSSLENFIADMGYPQEGLSIDRIENDGNYEPGNCRWATPVEQMYNRRSVADFFIEFNGERLTAWAWSRRTGIHPDTIKCRIKRGWTAEAALSTAAQKQAR